MFINIARIIFIGTISSGVLCSLGGAVGSLRTKK